MLVLILFTKEIYNPALRGYEPMRDARMVEVDTLSYRAVNEAFAKAVKGNLEFYERAERQAKDRGRMSAQAIDPGRNHKFTGYLAHVSRH